VQLPLYESYQPESQWQDDVRESGGIRKPAKRSGTGLFSKAVLAEGSADAAPTTLIADNHLWEIGD